MKRLMYIALAIFGNIGNMCLAAPQEETSQPKITITAQTITELENDFNKFIKELELVKYPWLQKLPEPDGWFNCALLKVVEWGTSWTRHGRLKPKETKIFLGRVFERNTQERDSTPYIIPTILQTGIQDLKKSNNYIQYLSNILNGMEYHDLKGRNLARLAELMEQEKQKYPDMPKSANMGNKEIVPDTEFGRFAATQLLATCYVEEGIFFKDKSQKSKHPHSRSKTAPEPTHETIAKS